jgi:hypothetical protein
MRIRQGKRGGGRVKKMEKEMKRERENTKQ